MLNPFATALDTLFEGPGAVAAVYYVARTGESIPLNVVRDRKDDIMAISTGHAISSGSVFQIRKTDLVGPPVKGDGILIGEQQLTLLADGIIDTMGLRWNIQTD